jgi:zinc protease
VGDRVIEHPQPQYLLLVNFTTEPARADELVDAAWEQITTLQSQGPSAAYLATAIEQERRLHEESLRTNGYWLNLLQDHALQPEAEALSDVQDLNSRLDAITPAQVQQSAQDHVRPTDYVKVILHPSSAEPK